RVPVVAKTAAAKPGIRSGVDRRAVIGIDDVAGSAARLAEVASVVVGADEVRAGVEQTRLLQADEDRVGAVLGAEAAVAETRQDRPARAFLARRYADLRAELAAALEDAEHVTRLGNLEADQWVEERDDAAVFHFPLGRRRHSLQAEWLAAHAIGLAEASALVGHGAVVVEGSAPEHAAVAHH